MTEGIWPGLEGLFDSWAPAPVLALTALLETVFPPFPGDVIYIAAGGLARSAGVSPWLLWVPGFAGCGFATFLLDAAGRGSGPRWIERMVVGGSSGQRGMARAKALLAKHGGKALFLSRFIPGIRSLLVVAAAWSGMGRASVLVPSLASAMVWYGLLALLAVLLGSNLEAASAFMAAYGRFAMIVLALALVFFILIRRRRAGR